MVFQSDAPLPEVFRPSHMTPSAHLRPHEFKPDLDPDVSETLSRSDSDDHVTLAELVKGKIGGVESLVREVSPELEADTSHPKRPRTTVQKRRASSDVR